MSEGTRHFISHEWLLTMRTLPIEGEHGIFLYSVTERATTRQRKPEFHAEMHSPSVVFPWPKFLYFRSTGIQTRILALCVGNNARNDSKATWRFRLCDLLNWYLIMRVLPVMDVGFPMWFTYLYSYYLILSLERPPLSPERYIRLVSRVPPGYFCPTNK